MRTAPFAVAVALLAVPAVAGAQRDSTYRSDAVALELRYPASWRTIERTDDRELAAFAAARPAVKVPVSWRLFTVQGDSVARPPAPGDSTARWWATGLSCMVHYDQNTPREILGLFLTVYRGEPGAKVEGPRPWRQGGLDGLAGEVTLDQGHGANFVSFARPPFTTTCMSRWTRTTRGQATRVLKSLRAR